MQRSLRQAAILPTDQPLGSDQIVHDNEQPEVLVGRAACWLLDGRLNLGRLYTMTGICIATSRTRKI